MWFIFQEITPIQRSNSKILPQDCKSGNQCESPLKFQSCPWWVVLDAILCHKVTCDRLMFLPPTPQQNRPDIPINITKILWKVALKTPKTLPIHVYTYNMNTGSIYINLN